jgi:uncharacterized protein (TIGR02588 family)
VSHSRKSDRGDEVSRYEWIVGATGALIFLFLVTYFVRQAVLPETPVRLEARVDSVRASQPGTFIVYFTAWNRGGASAVDVRLSATLQPTADGTSADATIGRIAAGSRQSGAFLFPRDPGQGEVRIRILSYQTP